MTNEFPSPQPNDWQHLTGYGYAPGGYMSRCHKCGATPTMDKRAMTCRPCAEKMYAAALARLAPAAIPAPEGGPALSADALADKCEAWLQAGGASNIVDAYEAGYLQCDRDQDVCDHALLAILERAGEGATVADVLDRLSTQAPAEGDGNLRAAAQMAFEMLSEIRHWDHRGDTLEEAWDEKGLGATWRERLTTIRLALAAKPNMQPKGTPVTWQYRLRIRGQGAPWSQWHECSEPAYGDYVRSNHEQWEYETRALGVVGAVQAFAVGAEPTYHLSGDEQGAMRRALRRSVTIVDEQPRRCPVIEAAAREAIAAWKDCNHGSMKLKFIKAMEDLEAASKPPVQPTGGA